MAQGPSQLVTRAMFIGSHFWLMPEGTEFTSPAAGEVAQDGAANWPDEADPIWADVYLGVVEGGSIDPKYGPREEILAPSPGSAKMRDIVIPYAVPEIKFTMLQVGALAVQLALNTQALFNSDRVQFNPNGGGGPGIKGIIWCQKYDHKNNLVLNFKTWGFLQLDGAFDIGVKTMSKPKFIMTSLDSDNNTGVIGV